MDRRQFIMTSAAASTLAACSTSAGGAAMATSGRSFPEGFLWGASTAGHQVEGNNVNADLWYLENLPQTAFAAPSGDAVNSFNLWEQDQDLVKAMGLNTYRFSLEWARIEPAENLFSTVMLDLYKAMIEGCLARGLTPVVTFNHFTAPRWFSAKGGWTNPSAPETFARFCKRATEHLGEHIGYGVTMNEPNISLLLTTINLPDFVWAKQEEMLALATRLNGGQKFCAMNVANRSDFDVIQANLEEGHHRGRSAIKSVRPDLPVGFSLAVIDDQAQGPNSIRDEVRERLYGRWMRAARDDDYMGVQNYERSIWDDKGKVEPPADAVRNYMGSEIYAPSLAGAVRYAHETTGKPIMVSEHGVGTDDDAVRQSLIPAALSHLRDAMDEGVPVIGYCHWSLLDNFEWVFGYGPKFGLVEVDRSTFRRTPKPSAAIYGAIARANAIQEI